MNNEIRKFWQELGYEVTNKYPASFDDGKKTTLNTYPTSSDDEKKSTWRAPFWLIKDGLVSIAALSEVYSGDLIPIKLKLYYFLDGEFYTEEDMLKRIRLKVFL